MDIRFFKRYTRESAPGPYACVKKSMVKIQYEDIIAFLKMVGNSFIKNLFLKNPKVNDGFNTGFMLI